MEKLISIDTIAAIATPPGSGGIGIVRLSGKDAKVIAENITRKKLQPRFAHYGNFYSSESEVIDQGITLYFQMPNSFTGEDVVEFQAHGGPVILDWLMDEILSQGARLARSGEFSERAYLNNKLDLAQAEAIADLINSQSRDAARSALNSLQGVFSNKVESLVGAITQLRIYVESAIDFPEEEIDFLSDGKVNNDLVQLIENLTSIIHQANQGAILRNGMSIVIAGKPNAGKSSLLNILSGKESAIVTNIEGTTRDILREEIIIDGLPVHIIDTAGLRDSFDEVEQEGIRRAWQEIGKADAIIYLIDSTSLNKGEKFSLETLWPQYFQQGFQPVPLIVVLNKSDLSGIPPGVDALGNFSISAKSGEGVDLLREKIKTIAGYSGSHEGGFSARRRHLDALQRALISLNTGKAQLENSAAGELLAEDLRNAQNCLSEITGEFTPDDLLGEIFSSFCIGK